MALDLEYLHRIASNMMEKETNAPREIRILTQDLIWAKHDLIEYKLLFFENKKQLDMLVKAAGNFFHRLYLNYWDRFTLSISRLTDPALQNRNENLSLYRVRDYCQDRKIDETKVESLLSQIEQLASSFRSRRMKFVAHRDLPHALGDLKIPDHKLDLATVENVYSLSGELLNLFHRAYDDLTWSWDLIDSNGAWSLLVRIKESIVYEDLKRKRLDWKLDREELQNSTVGDTELTSH